MKWARHLACVGRGRMCT